MSTIRTCKVSTAQFGECWLPEGHQGCHEAQTTARRWERLDRGQIAAEGFIPATPVLDLLERAYAWCPLDLGSDIGDVLRAHGRLGDQS